MEKTTLKKVELNELKGVRKVTKKESTKAIKKESKKEPEKEIKKKKGIFGSIKSYFKGVKKEMGRIRWAGWKELLKYSVATIVFIVFFGLYFYLIDLVVALLRSLA